MSVSLRGQRHRRSPQTPHLPQGPDQISSRGQVAWKLILGDCSKVGHSLSKRASKVNFLGGEFSKETAWCAGWRLALVVESAGA